MELIYFISGILTVGVVYGVRLLSKVKSSHTELLAKYQSHSNISSIRYSEMGDMIEEMKVYVGDIQGKLSKDSYKETVKLKKILDTFNTDLARVEKKVSSDIDLTEKSFTKAFSEIQQLKNTIKALKEDPNFLNRY